MEQRPKARKSWYKVLRKVMATNDITSYIQNTTAKLTGFKISKTYVMCPDDDWLITSAPHPSRAGHIAQVHKLSSSYKLG
jgi:hypothetical protein